MSVTLIQLPQEFFETMNNIQKKLDMINYNAEKTESLNVEIIETLERTNSFLDKMCSILDDIRRKQK